MGERPQIVHAAVLDSTLPPQVQVVVERPGSVQRAFNLLFAGCAADPACATAYPNLEAVFYQLVADLNVAPLRYQARHPRTGVVHTIALTGDRLVLTFFEASHYTDIIPYIPLAAFSLRQRDTSLLSLTADRLVFNDGGSHGLAFSVQCAEEHNLTHPGQMAAALRRVRPEISRVFANEANFRTCETWGAARLSPSIKSPTVGGISTLLLAGEMDPATPPEFAQIAARTLRNDFLFEIRGGGHNVRDGSPCANAIMMAFLSNPARRPDLACIAQMKPPVWVMPPAHP
jgi:pimeloyl-ACP methyl ester carboxylesterase